VWKNHVLFVLLCFLWLDAAHSQGIVRGKITDSNGESLIGVVVVLKPSTLAAGTDLDGFYAIHVPDSALYTLRISYLGYSAKEEQIQVKNNEVLIKNTVLVSASSKLNEVVVTAKAVKGKNAYMDKMKQNSATTFDYVSAETMKKTGDANLVAAVARVSGVSTTGGFITVRGIGDRYVKTTINGLRIPTLDPFTNNIKLDLFPASVVDNVIITKTASPDLPGDWAGAYLSVETKDFPENLSVNVETAFGYNSQTSFKNVVSSQHSSTDWLGYDTGFRDHNMNTFATTIVSPSLYEEFVALGLGNYFKSMGVTSTWTSSPGAETYYKLGLVQLGLLSKSSFNDPAAVEAAKHAYNQGAYHARAFDIINAGAVKSNQSFPNNWRTTVRKAPLSFSQNLSIGNQFNVFGRPLGFLAVVRYISYVQSDPHAVYSRANSSRNTNGVPSDVDTAYQKTSKETNGWNGLFTLSYKYNKNNSIGFLFMPNVNGVNTVSFATIAGNGQSYQEKQFYESRKQLVYQVKTEHYLPFAKAKVQGHASYTKGSSIAPDFKVAKIPIDTFQQNGTAVSGTRYYRYLKENIFDSRLSAEIPLPGDGPSDGVRKMKFGAAFQREDRKNDQYAVNLNSGLGANQLVAGDQGSDPFSLDKFQPRPVILNGSPTHSVLRYYEMNDLPNNHGTGYSQVSSYFAMADYTLFQRLRMSAGLRAEQARIYTDVNRYDSLHLPVNDPRRHTDQFLINNPGTLNELSLLPSISLIYKLKNQRAGQVNLRGSFSRTVARPSIRELSDIATYDYELNDLVTGNPGLKMVHISNYDVRAESFFNSGDNVSISVFYKDFKDHIELINYTPNGFFWINNPNRTWLSGIELEGAKKLSSHFELRANATWVSSHSTFQPAYLMVNGRLEPKGEFVTRPMFGQAPFVFNAIASYRADSLGLTVALSYNIQGDRLVIDGGNGVPDVYERPRNLLDLKISKRLGKHFSASLKVNDVLNTSIVRSYRYAKGFILDYDRYRYGTNYVVSMVYTL
jgi:hypothetical protein